MQIRLPTLKPTGVVNRSSKLGYQWPHKRDLCPPKIFKKNEKTNIFFLTASDSMFLCQSLRRNVPPFCSDLSLRLRKIIFMQIYFVSIYHTIITPILQCMKSSTIQTPEQYKPLSSTDASAGVASLVPFAAFALVSPPSSPCGWLRLRSFT